MDLHYGGRVGEVVAVGEAAYIAGAGADVVDVVTRESAAQALGVVVQLHFDKIVERKRAADAQKQELWRLFEDHVWFEDRWMVASFCDE
jgi:hypothetical protein